MSCVFEKIADQRYRCIHCGDKVRSATGRIFSNCNHAKTKTDNGGAGTELRKLLKRFGLPSCKKCDSRAMLMNQRGPDWCEENLDTVVGWLRDAAEKRELPFSATVAKLLIRRAIKKTKAGEHK